MQSITLERATAADDESIVKLLERVSLPTEGLSGHLSTTVVAKRAGQVVGSAALEVYPDGALLRSVAVDPAVQGSGLGGRLTEAALEVAAERGVPAVYLLTTTADRFFPRFGFSAITRAEVPASVQQSVEFRGVCPASAHVMRRVLAR